MISIKNLNKKYDQKVVYKNFNIDIEENKIVAVLGESGSGKTTLLNIILGLTEFEGEIAGIKQPVSAIFQKDRLIPNLTVEENLKLVCPNVNVANALSSVGLAGCENLYPKSLSAGMSRRVAILRAIEYNSNLLVMDEPFINLDLAVKYSVIKLIKERQKNSPRTIIFVTHDIKEAVSLAERVVLIANGEIVIDKLKTPTNQEELEKELFLSITKGVTPT
ncbi:MAG: ABC transporter ATP-binding protein [Clostridia bacterium]|nr:ABC transporter ATP-binding protein [Clostridia bacterium]